MTGSQGKPIPRWSIGPGFLVAAAFIGPGTVTTATLAGVRFGASLLWVVAASTFAAVVLQEMAGRLGLVLRQPLGEIVRRQTAPALWRRLLLGLIFVAILLGNTAYQAGNLLGAAKGFDLLASGAGAGAGAGSLVVTSLALAAGVLLFTGNPRLVARALTGLVVVMSVLFLGLAWRVAPSPAVLLRGLSPVLPDDATTTVLALFGTTIVPYNLFLYASLVGEKWSREAPLSDSLASCRWDIALAVGLGGVVTAAIVVVGSAAGSEPDFSLEKLPEALRGAVDPRQASIVLGLGLLAAGLTSAVTAPLAASFAAAGLFGFSDQPRGWPFRAVWLGVLSVGWLAAIWLRGTPQQVIVLAQAANGLVLPIMALVLWRLVSRRDLLGRYANSLAAHALSLAAVAAVLLVWWMKA